MSGIKKVKRDFRGVKIDSLQVYVYGSHPKGRFGVYIEDEAGGRTEWVYGWVVLSPGKVTTSLERAQCISSVLQDLYGFNNVKVWYVDETSSENSSVCDVKWYDTGTVATYEDEEGSFNKWLDKNKGKVKRFTWYDNLEFRREFCSLSRNTRLRWVGEVSSYARFGVWYENKEGFADNVDRSGEGCDRLFASKKSAQGCADYIKSRTDMKDAKVVDYRADDGECCETDTRPRCCCCRNCPCCGCYPRRKRVCSNISSYLCLARQGRVEYIRNAEEVKNGYGLSLHYTDGYNSWLSSVNGESMIFSCIEEARRFARYIVRTFAVGKVDIRKGDGCVMHHVEWVYE